uniref:Chloride conductance regulatory protein ICln n=1 Tax=Globisporangium ultimum (strain ATCC 200006 / CBS 805.95 / DAOM BR144) TaxID=431595 RepID=K3WI74_GLOUD
MNVVTRSELSADGAPLLRTGGDQEEFLMASFARVEIHMSSSDESDALPLNRTTGALFVTTKRVVWIGDRNAAARVGYGWETSLITLHAISRDTSAFPKPCLYCQIDAEDISEVRFVPFDPKQLQELFDEFSKSAELNPDEDEDDGDGGDDGWIYDEDEVHNGARAAEIAAHLDSVLQISPALLERQPESGQFDDADEDLL